MTSPIFDPASDARFRAITEGKHEKFDEQIKLLWKHNHKRRSEIEEIKNRINGAVYAFAASAVAVAWILIKPKLGL